MASNTQAKDQKGYDHKFVDPVPDELLCLICISPARDPQQSTCCGKVFCKACVDELKKHSDKCPGCRGDINCFPDKRSDRNIKEMKTRCDNADNGCEWIGELRSLDEHLVTCDYTFLSCPNECDNGGKILRKNMEKHKTEECPRRQYICPHCEESGEYEERTTTHLEECPLMEIPCTNDGCSELIARCDIDSHLYECDFEIVPCRYAALGCQEEVLRKDMEKHEHDRELHIDFAVDAMPTLRNDVITLKHWNLPHLQQQVTDIKYWELPDLEQRVSDLEEQDSLQGDVARLDYLRVKQEEMINQQSSVLAHLKSIILAQSMEISELKLKLESQVRAYSYTNAAYGYWSGPQVQPTKVDSIFKQDLNGMVFKFTDYAKRKSSSRSTSVFSSPVYSSPGGYKMCINVYPNGNGNGKGTHVSVYAYLMRGENDNHLSWPFTGTVTIELLNQLSDQQHILMRIKLSEDTSKRVLDGNRATNGCGYPCYIAHSSLDYNAATNCQYLKDDCLYFRVKIDSDATTKPWLSFADVF